MTYQPAKCSCFKRFFRQRANKLNPAGKPKEIDIMPSDENKTFEGIYQIDKTTLKICLCPGSNDGRPSEFVIKDGKQHVLIIMERAK